MLDRRQSLAFKWRPCHWKRYLTKLLSAPLWILIYFTTPKKWWWSSPPFFSLRSNSVQRFRGTNYRYRSSSHMLRFSCLLHLFFLYFSLAHCLFFTFTLYIHDTFSAFYVPGSWKFNFSLVPSHLLPSIWMSLSSFFS